MEPIGIDALGSRRSPESPSPAMTPVTAGKNTANATQYSTSPVDWANGGGLGSGLAAAPPINAASETPTSNKRGSWTLSAIAAPLEASNPMPRTITKAAGTTGRLGQINRMDSASPNA